MTGRFRASRPGCSSQPTTRLESDTEGPLSGSRSGRISRCGSHPGQGQGSAWDGLHWGCLEPPSASLVFPPWQTKLAQNSCFQEGFSVLSDLWPTGHHSQLAPGVHLLLCLLSLISRPSVNASSGLRSFLHFLVASRGRRPQTEAPGREEANPLLRILALCKARAPGPFVCNGCDQAAFLPGDLDLNCQQWARG